MSKTCVVCGADCDGKPRVKDPKGRYYCKACHESLSEKVGSSRPDEIDLTAPRPSPRTAPRPGHDVDTSDEPADIAGLAALAAAAPAAIPSTLACPACQTSLSPGAVLCINCGHDLRSGKAQKTKVTSMPSLPGLAPPRVGGGGGLDAVVGPWTVSLGALTTFGIAFAFVALTSLAEYFAMRNVSIPADAPRVMQWSRGPIGSAWLALTMSIGTLLYYIVAPWWLRVRLKAAGDPVEMSAARSAYFLTVLPAILVAVVVVLLSLGGSQNVELLDALKASNQRALALRVALSVGCIWLFFIARRNFDVHPVRAALGIVVVPMVWYAAQTVITMKSISGIDDLRQGAGLVAPAPVSAAIATRTFDGNAEFDATFTYPGDWQVEHLHDENVAAGIGSRMLLLRSPDRAEARLVLADEEVDVNGILENVVPSIERGGATVTTLGDLTEYGGLKGTGREFRVVRRGQGIQLTIFLADACERLSAPLYVQTSRLEADSAARRGFNDILRSFRTTK